MLKCILKDVFTARNGLDYSLTKLIGISASGAMIYKFCAGVSPDFLGFAGGISAIIAALAAKYHVEKGEEDATNKEGK